MDALLLYYLTTTYFIERLLFAPLGPWPIAPGFYLVYLDRSILSGLGD